jgi:hypothetical protein
MPISIYSSSSGANNAPTVTASPAQQLLLDSIAFLPGNL